MYIFHHAGQIRLVETSREAQCTELDAFRPSKLATVTSPRQVGIATHKQHDLWELRVASEEGPQGATPETWLAELHPHSPPSPRLNGEPTTALGTLIPASSVKSTWESTHN